MHSWHRSNHRRVKRSSGKAKSNQSYLNHLEFASIPAFEIVRRLREMRGSGKMP
jgi:hypothetical protein